MRGGYVGYQAGQTKQLAQAPFSRIVISLKKDRTGGENFNALEGAFFYVESCDVPCRVSFNKPDDSQSVAMTSGFQLNMPFSGITLFHDDYTNVGSSNTTFSLVVYVSRDPRALSQFVNPAVQFILPWRSTVYDVPSGQIAVTFPIFARTRFFTVKSELALQCSADPLICSVNFDFQDLNGAPIVPPSNLIKSGINYNQVNSVACAFESSKNAGAGTYVFNIDRNNIPIPGNADRLIMTMAITLPANVTSFILQRHSANLS